jgi:hypothetical protein
MNHTRLFVSLILFAANRLNGCADEAPRRIESARDLWAGYDPRAEPLEIEVAKVWDEGAIRFEQLSFTGETWQGRKVRVFAYRGAPVEGDAKLPGILHLHGGGQTASLDWVRHWAGRGYVCVSHDFCGPGLGRDAEMVTQWGAAPAYMADPSGPRSSLHPTARYNSWYHWILVARRALTLLEDHPRVDSAAARRFRDLGRRNPDLDARRLRFASGGGGTDLRCGAKHLHVSMAVADRCRG